MKGSGRCPSVTRRWRRRGAPASPAEAAAQVALRFSAAPCRHLNLAALRASTKYRFTHEQLATLPAEQLAALLNDPEVSYECPLVALRRSSEHAAAWA